MKTPKSYPKSKLQIDMMISQQYVIQILITSLASDAQLKHNNLENDRAKVTQKRQKNLYEREPTQRIGVQIRISLD